MAVEAENTESDNGEHTAEGFEVFDVKTGGSGKCALTAGNDMPH